MLSGKQSRTPRDSLVQARKRAGKFHIEGRYKIAQSAGGPLDIVVRGDPDVMAHLQRDFRNVIYIDTVAYMKTIERQRATRSGNSKLDWITKQN